MLTTGLTGRVVRFGLGFALAPMSREGVTSTTVGHEDARTRRQIFLAWMTIPLAWAMLIWPAEAQEKQPGAEVFTRVCASCHGPDASGGQGPPLVPFKKELPELVAIVRQGIGLMPVIPRSQITDEEIAQVHAYLRGLGEQ